MREMRTCPFCGKYRSRHLGGHIRTRHPELIGTIRRRHTEKRTPDRLRRALDNADPIAVERLRDTVNGGGRLRRGDAHPDDRLAALITAVVRGEPVGRYGVNGETIVHVRQLVEAGDLCLT